MMDKLDGSYIYLFGRASDDGVEVEVLLNLTYLVNLVMRHFHEI